MVEVLEIFRPQVSKSDDPEWTPEFIPRKRLKRTYSSKNNSQKEIKYGGRQPRATLPQHRQIIQAPIVNVLGTDSCASSVAQSIFKLGDVPKDSIFVGDEQTSSTKAAQHRVHGMPKLTREFFKRLAKSISPNEWMLDDGLYSGLYALLMATVKSRPRSGSGTRSLFATCLRKVPDYIAEEQHWADEQDEDDDKDIATTIYGELEAFGSAQSGGWMPLREVVRAHGIAILGAAIKEHLVKPGTARGLITLCIQASAHDEAQSLIDSLLAVQQPLPKPQTEVSSLFERSIPLHVLWDLSDCFEGEKYFFSRLNMILKHGILPVEWMITRDMIPCWLRIIRSIEQHDHDVDEAVGLFQTAVILTYQSAPDSVSCCIHEHRLWSRSVCLSSKLRNLKKVPNSKVNQKGQACPLVESTGPNKVATTVTTYTSNMTAFIYSITNQRFEDIEEHHPRMYKSTREALLPVALHAHQLGIIKSGTSRVAHNAECMARVCVQLIGYILVTTRNSPDYEYSQFCMSFLDVLCKIDDNSKEAGLLISFLTSAAHISGRYSGNHFIYLQNMANTLLQIPDRVLCSQSTRKRLNALVLGAAFEFAEQTMQQEHLDWTLKLEESLEDSTIESSTTYFDKTPARLLKKPASSFRWEDSLCEWIARTPALVLATKRELPRNVEESSKHADASHEEEGTLSKSDGESFLRSSDTSPIFKDGHIRCTFEIRIPRIVGDECCTSNIEPTKTMPLGGKLSKDHENENVTDLWLQRRRLRKRPCLVDVTNRVQGLDQVARPKPRKLRSSTSSAEGLKRRLVGRSTMSLGYDRAEDMSDDELAI